jgi:hypothetical protein
VPTDLLHDGPRSDVGNVARGGVYLEHALVERLLGDAAAEPGALPQLADILAGKPVPGLIDL